MSICDKKQISVLENLTLAQFIEVLEISEALDYLSHDMLTLQNIDNDCECEEFSHCISYSEYIVPQFSISYRFENCKKCSKIIKLKFEDVKNAGEIVKELKEKEKTQVQESIERQIAKEKEELLRLTKIYGSPFIEGEKRESGKDLLGKFNAQVDELEISPLS